jgi:hypothetical protein
VPKAEKTEKRAWGGARKGAGHPPKSKEIGPLRQVCGAVAPATLDAINAEVTAGRAASRSEVVGRVLDAWATSKKGAP